MILSRFVRRLLALFTVSVAGATGLLFMASPAAANVTPDPGGPGSVAVVPVEVTVDRVVSDGIEWGMVALIALGAALLAAVATEFFDNYRQRHQHLAHI